jgi:dihydroorotase/N-acyl-D-amino-acid deacylase
MWLAILALAAGALQQPQLDLVIRGGTLVDGSGAPRRRADVGVRGDSIVAIGDLTQARAKRTLDASGLVVAPGFIDMHSHSDFTLLVDGRALSKVTQGVTTELLGESSSAAPAVGPARAELERSLAELELRLDWSTLGEYFRRLEQSRTSVNVLSTVASGQVRAAVVGYDDRPATAEELKQMEELVEQAMREGAAGLSSGLIYAPNRYASTEELIALAKVASRHDGFYLTHLRNEAERLLEAIAEAIEIARKARLPVEIIHFKRSGVRLDGGAETSSIQEAAALVERARSEGVAVTADVYPYHASQTTLSTRLPGWSQDGGRARMLERLRDPETRARIRDEVRARLAEGKAGATPETMLFGRTTFEAHRRYQGMRVSEIARAMEVEPAEAVIELVDKADGSTSAVYFGMREQDVEFALRLPWVAVGSDGTAVAPEGLLARSHPHPRWYGTFPRVLARYVRERKTLALEEAVHKMTGLPAERLRLSDRGLIAEARKADVVVFDPETIADRSSFERPHQLSVGVRWLLVNGEPVLEDGRHTGARPGRVLRRGPGPGAADLLLTGFVARRDESGRSCSRELRVGVP